MILLFDNLPVAPMKPGVSANAREKQRKTVNTFLIRFIRNSPARARPARSFPERRETERVESFPPVYLWLEFGGKCSNILRTFLSKLLMFLSGLVERVFVETPSQIRFLLSPSNISTTSVPTL